MKYEETCECGVVLEVTSDDPMMFARVKGRWKLDHEDHSLGRLRVKRKKLVGEIDELNQLADDLKVKMEEIRKQIDLKSPIVTPASQFDSVVKHLYDLSPTDVPFLSNKQAAETGMISKKSALEKNFGDWKEENFPAGTHEDQVMAAWHQVIKDKITRGDEHGEQGKQVQGKGDEGTTTPKRTFAKSWTQRNRLGRRGGQRQG